MNDVLMVMLPVICSICHSRPSSSLLMIVHALKGVLGKEGCQVIALKCVSLLMRCCKWRCCFSARLIMATPPCSCLLHAREVIITTSTPCNEVCDIYCVQKEAHHPQSPVSFKIVMWGRILYRDRTFSAPSIMYWLVTAALDVLLPAICWLK